MSDLLSQLTGHLGDPLAVASSWMLTYLIHSTILILSVWLICRGIPPLARRISPAAANVSWKLALVGGVVTATVQLAAGVTPALGALELETGPRVVERAAPALESEPKQILRERRVVHVGEDGEVTMLGVGSAPTAGVGAAPEIVPEPAARIVEETPAPLWPAIVLAVWVLGSMIALVRLAIAALRLRRRLSDRREVIDDPVLESFLTLCRDAEIGRKIRLTQSANIASPIALWRKEIVVPTRAVDELTPAAMRAVLAHELAHLERRDPHWLAFAAVVEALFIIQPLNRLARKGMRESAELLCDDWAIARTGDGVQFAKSLAELASWTHANRSSMLLAGMIGGERPLIRRVRRALDGDPQRFEVNEGARPTRTLLSLGSLAALIMLAPGAVNASPPTDTDAAETRKARKARDKAEKKAREAEDKARKARDKAERAAAEAERAAAEAAAEAERAAREQAEAHGPQHLIIRDGDDYLIIDENGVRMRGEGADIQISDGANPKMRVRIHDGDFDLDLDLDAETLEGMADAFLGEMLGGDFPGMHGPGGHGFPGMEGFEEIDDFEAFAEQWEAFGEQWGQQIEEEVERQRQQIDEEALERELEDAAREIERELQELRERKRSRGQRGQAAPMFAPPLPPAPPAPPAVAPVAPVPPPAVAAPVVAI